MRCRLDAVVEALDCSGGARERVGGVVQGDLTFVGDGDGGLAVAFKRQSTADRDAHFDEVEVAGDCGDGLGVSSFRWKDSTSLATVEVTSVTPNARSISMG